MFWFIVAIAILILPGAAKAYVGGAVIGLLLLSGL
jgi:hypothetical protein